MSSTKEIRILITGVGRRIELIQAFRTAALTLDKKLIIYGADMAGTAPAIAYCDYGRKVVAMKDSNYIDNLLQICRDDSIDIVVPTIDTDLLVLSDNKERFAEIGTMVMISSPDRIKICRDKNITSEYFVKCGLKAPMPVNDWREYRDGYPAFIKPKDGSSSVNAFKVENVEELEVYANQIEDYIVQPFVDGKEYTIDIFCDWEGHPLSIVPRERVQVRAGEVLKTRITMDDRMIKEAEILCEAFKPCGPMTVQLIKDNNTGDNYFIEINPRFGGGAPLSMKAGARSAEALLKLIDKEIVSPYTDIADGTVYSRFDQSVYIDNGWNHGAVIIEAVSKVLDYIPVDSMGVLFDLDDTLYSEKDYIKSGYKVVAKYLGDEKYADCLWYYFEQNKPAIDLLLNDIGRTEEKDIVLNLYRSHIPVISLYDGIIEIINRLKQEGKKVGIITDGRPTGQHNKIKSLGLDAILSEEDIIITDELGGEQFRKPCDIAFRIMQRRWKIPFEQMVYIGDNPTKDFQAPQQLGMKSIWYCNVEGLYNTRA